MAGELEKAVFSLTGELPLLRAAGRTDAGVHALDQAVSFATSFPLPAEKWPGALNARLPPTISVWEAREVPLAFHPRRAAKSKVYRYLIWNHPFPSPFLRPYSWHLPRPLDAEAMSRAAGLLVGRRDFSAFRALGSTPTSPVRHLFRAEVRAEGPLLSVILEADGFLYRMARLIVGTLVRVGEGKISLSEVEKILSRQPGYRSGPAAPARGLFLERVFLPGDGQAPRSAFWLFP